MYRNNRVELTGVPEEADMSLNGGIVSDRVLGAYRKASARLKKLGIPHVVVGGLAVGAWGHPRATKDVDFLIKEKDVFKGSIISTFKPGVPISVGGVVIDYLTIEALKLRKPELIKGPVAPLEVVFAMKLKARRMQDNADLIALLKKGADVEVIDNWLKEQGLDVERRHLKKLVVKAKAES
jgi:hypothetical protein